MIKENLRDMIDAGAAKIPADIVIKNGQLVNVTCSEIYNADIAVYRSRIVATGDCEAYIGDNTRIIDVLICSHTIIIGVVMRITLFQLIWLFTFVFSTFGQLLHAEEGSAVSSGKTDDFDISKYVVVVDNPNLMRHKRCLGVVYDQVTVIVPRECGYRRFGSITVYPTAEDSNHQRGGIGTLDGMDRSLNSGKLIALYLEKQLHNKRYARFVIPDYKCTAVWRCYYLAMNSENKVLINRRDTHRSGDLEHSNDSFLVLATDKDTPAYSVDFIPGAFLFNEKQEVVGFSYSDYSIYLLFSQTKHSFYQAHFTENISQLHRGREL